MTMILTTMGFSVFAAGETPAADTAQAAEDFSDSSAPEAAVEEAAAETAPAAVEQEYEANSVMNAGGESNTETPVEEPVSTEEPQTEPAPQNTPAVEASITITRAELVDYAGGKANIVVEWTSTGVLNGFAVTSSSGDAPVSITENSANFALTPGGKYTFQVSAKREDGSEIISGESAEVVTEEPVKPTITITNVELVDYAGGKANVVVQWESTGILRNFTAKANGLYDPVSVDEANKTAYFALDPGREPTKKNKSKKKSYTFRVFAIGEDGTRFKSERSEKVWTEKVMVENLESHPSYNAVVLDWDKDDVADHYVVYRGTKKVATVTNDGNTSKYDEDRVLYEVKKLEEYKKYTFKVVPYYDETSDEEAAGEMAKVKDQPVRPISYNLKIKQSVPYGTLKRKNGKGPKSVALKAGETIKAVGFNSGKYVFEYKGAVFNIVKQRISGVSCTYSKDITYDKISAEAYVNGKGLTSPTKQLIWVNTYTQELYIFKGSKGKWKLNKHWPVSTGKASSPTPTGNDGIKEVWKKLSTRHNLKWWTCFSTMNAFHGLFDSWRKKLGNPASGGCIRNEVKNAKWIYDNIKYKTTVLIR